MNRLIQTIIILAAMHIASATPPDAEEMFKQARALANGDGVTRDPAKAVEIYGKAAALGHAKAQHNLATHLIGGLGVKRDAVESARWFQKAAEQGALLSQVAVGKLYARGNGVKADSKTALLWYEKAAVQGSAEAQFLAGTLHFTGEESVPVNHTKAREWFARAAAQDHVGAQNSLGVIFERGLGVRADPAEAARLYRLAAERGLAKAQANLGMMCSRGEGTPRDNAEAYKWLKLSALQGEATGANFLADWMLVISPVEVAEGERRLRQWKAASAGGAK